MMSEELQPGEKPIKIVKARPDHKVPPELRGERTLELYGYWQTEPYVPPKVVDVSLRLPEHSGISGSKFLPFYTLPIAGSYTAQRIWKHLHVQEEHVAGRLCPLAT